MNLIISVCRLSEGGRPKCHKYWPEGDSDSDKEFKVLINSEFKISKIEEKKLGDTLVERTFKITTSEGLEHIVKQVHYTGWPDHGVPTGHSIDEFSLMLN